MRKTQERNTNIARTRNISLFSSQIGSKTRWHNSRSQPRSLSRFQKIAITVRKLTCKSVANPIVLLVLENVQKRRLRMRAERGLNFLQCNRIPSVGDVNFAAYKRQPARQRLDCHSHSRQLQLRYYPGLTASTRESLDLHSECLFKLT